MTAALVVAMLVVAGIDWWAVATDRRRVEYVAKPLTMVVLIALAVSLDPVDDEAARRWFVVALLLSLLGDVFLMLPTDRFVWGLAAFLGGHLAYIAGMVAFGFDLVPAVFIPVLVGVVVAIVTLGRAIVSGARRHAAALGPPVATYIAVITAMVVAAAATGNPWFLVGALLFYVSDAMIGITRFVTDVRFGRVIVMVTYHLGQLLLVLGLR